MFDHCVKAQSFSFLTNLLLFQSKILQMFKWKTRPLLLSFSFRYTNIGIQYFRSIEIGKGVLCSRAVFLNPSIHEDLPGISEFVLSFAYYIFLKEMRSRIACARCRINSISRPPALTTCSAHFLNYLRALAKLRVC